jgi:hypothetical protein
MKNPDDEVPLRYCTECTQPYERVLILCPYCGAKWEPSNRSKPEYVDGDLFELTPEALALMRGELAKVDESAAALESRMKYANVPGYVVGSAVKKHGIKQQAQAVLREQISWWAAYHRQLGRGDQEIYRRFYFAFDVDIMTAQTLGRTDATNLAMKIWKQIEVLKYVNPR